MCAPELKDFERGQQLPLRSAALQDIGSRVEQPFNVLPLPCARWSETKIDGALNWRKSVSQVWLPVLTG